MTGKPKFEFIDVTTKKKMSRMNEISAVELALIPGTFLLPFAMTYHLTLLMYLNTPIRLITVAKRPNHIERTIVSVYFPILSIFWKVKLPFLSVKA